MKIIGYKGCPKCEILRLIYPDLEYIEIPDISLGFGDSFAKFTKLFGFSPCKKCRIRQYKFNKWLPYWWRLKHVDEKIIKAKELAYLNGVKEFPILIDDYFTKILKNKVNN